MTPLTPTFTNHQNKHYGLRFYNPDTGRWLDRDPIEERGGKNVYAFIRNRVLDTVNRLGLSIWYSSIEIRRYHGSGEASIGLNEPSYFDTDDWGPGNYSNIVPAVGFKTDYSHTDTTFDISMSAWSRFDQLPQYWLGADYLQMSYFTSGKWKVCGYCARGYEVQWMLTTDYTESSISRGDGVADASFHGSSLQSTEDSNPPNSEHGSATGQFTGECTTFSFNVGGNWNEEPGGQGIQGSARIVALIRCR